MAESKQLTTEERHELWDNFLKKFPLESLKTMPLETYVTNRDDQQSSFCYMVEFGTKELGDISGSPAQKFGIYRWKNDPSTNSYVHNFGKYAWQKRLGNSAQEAYEKIRQEVYKIATLADKGDFDTIAKSRIFGPVVKWKIAFMYAHGQLLCVFNKAYLEAIAKNCGMSDPQEKTIPEIQRFLMERKGDRDLFEFYDEQYSKLPISDKKADKSTNSEVTDAPDQAQDQSQNSTPAPYTKDDFLNEVFITEAEFDKLVNLLERKKNIILQGAPGVGKTYTAKHLAYAMLGTKNDSHIKVVQFHQNYSYEDFIMGYKPNKEGGFVLEEGVFYEFCKNAENDKQGHYFFIIDEINRGNLSKIFGELLMLIENSYRGDSIKLAYSVEEFCVPENVYIIGMMNTADRSLAMIDYALRRRFSFYEMKPAFGNKAFQDNTPKNNMAFNKLIEAVVKINEDIEKDEALGSGFCIGHSYFCGLKENELNSELESIVEFELAPMLREYYFDNPDKAEEHIKALRQAIKDGSSKTEPESKETAEQTEQPAQ